MMHKPAMVNFNRRGSCGIVDSKEEPVVEYKCDAGDKPVGARTLTTVYDALAETGPFRYRGYACDEGMGLYPLQNRCYNPDRGRTVYVLPEQYGLFRRSGWQQCPDWYAGQGIILYSYKLVQRKKPHKTSVPVPYSDRNVDNNRNSGSGARGEVVSFPVQNEEPEVAAAAINTGLALVLLFGVVFFLTGIPLFV